MPYDNDVLAKVHIAANGRRAAYESLRQSATDIPVLTCAASVLDGTLRVVIGARPMRAVALEFPFPETGEALTEICRQVEETVQFGSNLRGSGEYRRRMAGVLCRRAVCLLKEGASC